MTSPVSKIRFGHAYRPDIDGLRALAIIPVVLFHYGFAAVPGGYVGVDIFFVISGFLITGIISGEIAAGSFSIAGFYERRIRRILPALLVVVAATACGAYALLTPRDMVLFGGEVWYSGFFSTNFLYFRKDGYFDGASSMRLLLHTWSLSVEEQFYILMPLILLAAHRHGRQARIAVAVLLTVSLLFSSIAVYHFSSAAFYLLPSRAWELLCGALLAFQTMPMTGGARTRAILSTGGLALLAVGVFGFTNATPFPGLAALVPCLGTAILIGAADPAHPSPVHRILTLRPLVLIGRISYSLYLWHWPLLVLSKYFLVRDPDAIESIGLILGAVLLSIATYRFVEVPFRTKRFALARRRLFAAAAAVLLVMAGFGQIARLNGGFPTRLNAEAKRYADAALEPMAGDDACMTLPPDKIRLGEVCTFGKAKPTPPDFAVWGDSHSGALFPTFQAEAEENALWGLHFGGVSCPPLLGVTVSRADLRDLACPDFNAAALSGLSARGVHTVFLVARWALYSESWPKTGVDARNKPVFLTDDASTTRSDEESKAVFARGLERTLHSLTQRGIQVYVVEQIPEALADIPNGLAIARSWGRPSSVLAPSRAFTDARQSWVRGILADARRHYRLTVVPVEPRLCGEDRCRIELDGRPLYRDNNHLSAAGALYVKPAFDAVFQTRFIPPS